MQQQQKLQLQKQPLSVASYAQTQLPLQQQRQQLQQQPHQQQQHNMPSPSGLDQRPQFQQRQSQFVSRQGSRQGSSAIGDISRLGRGLRTNLPSQSDSNLSVHTPSLFDHFSSSGTRLTGNGSSSSLPGGPSRKDVNSKTPSFNGSPVASDTSHRFVTGAPTRDHWKSDAYAPECSLCGQRFSLLIRRHHCRRCGDIFCSSCCDVTVRLDQNAAFHPAGLICRVCQPCYKEFQSHLIPLKTPQPALDDSLDNDDEANSIPINLKENVKDVAETPMLSVPTDWAWSTF
ncbi:hypothetical protein BASA50_005167 [Batrachochytrium salamandrivorans]|uniref:FYVE-type domain-containing protein n=1 Tax=Batrachochytrium salamandrivorans TaxID=1357716 RepID=A0ABQ8FE30_9FUNG|nr:hypothetical protein BASA60_007785 [Batrachochytrium salamandrivorans]KAH6596462.1 hypothetical protein BASA50_005167 [Batrachochytrium salamandrivorans]KAH9250637.1 hypothetical protein BASA81_011557 [Batrachochytrium salamandrivorans]